jgi:hypothetical protein
VNKGKAQQANLPEGSDKDVKVLPQRHDGAWKGRVGDWRKMFKGQPGIVR